MVNKTKHPNVLQFNENQLILKLALPASTTQLQTKTPDTLKQGCQVTPNKFTLIITHDKEAERFRQV